MFCKSELFCNKLVFVLTSQNLRCNIVLVNIYSTRRGIFIKKFFANAAANLVALFPTILYLSLERYDIGVNGIDMIAVYAVVSVLILMAINVRYCVKNATFNIYPWWAVMIVAELICLGVHYGALAFCNDVLDKEWLVPIVVFAAAALLITLSSAVCQIVFAVIKRRRTKMEEPAVQQQ